MTETGADARLRVVDAALVCLEDPEALIRLVAGCDDYASASVALSTAFGLPDVVSEQVLGLQLHRVTRSSRTHLAQEKQELMQQIEQQTADN